MTTQSFSLFNQDTMKVIYLNKPYDINLVPRIYPEVEEELTLELRNESSDLTFQPEIAWIAGNSLTVTITSGVPLGEFQSMDKYEMTLTNGLSIVYKGKLIIVDETTNVQNFIYTDQSNSRFENL